MEKIRLGLVGAGAMAQEHLKVLTRLEEYTVVGLTSRTASKAQQLLGQFGLSCFYPSLDELVSQAKPQALRILVGEESMAQVAAEAMRFGLPLFIEKPAGLTVQDNVRLAKQAKEKNVRTMVGYNRRYYSIFHKGLELLRSKGPLLGIAVEGHERMWRVRPIAKFSPTVLDHWMYANSTHTLDL